MRYLLPLLMFMVGCAPITETPTPMPTRELSAPTLAPSPTVQILRSDEIYGDTSTDGQSNATAASLPVNSGLPPLPLGTVAADGAQLVQVVLANGTQLTGELYENSLGERRPAVLLLSTERSNWATLPARLLALGYTVLTMEFPMPTAEDIPALILATIEMGTVDPSRLAVVATVNTADAVLIGCAEDLLCRSLVLLSPQMTQLGLDAVPAYQPRPLLAISAQDDTLTYSTAVTLGNTTSGTLLSTDVGRGTGLLINPTVIEGILNFLQAHL